MQTLGQSDLDIYLQIVHYARQRTVDDELIFLAHRLLREIGRGTSGADYLALVVGRRGGNRGLQGTPALEGRITRRLDRMTPIVADVLIIDSPIRHQASRRSRKPRS